MNFVIIFQFKKFNEITVTLFLMKFLLIFNKNALFLAIEKEDEDMLRLLLSSKRIKVNFQCIFDRYFFHKIANQKI